MIKNYIKITFRNLLRNKVSTSINLLGLSLGISVCLLIFLLIDYELNFDNFHSRRVLVAFVIAVPLGWYFMNDWLSQFPYRIEITFGSFAAAGIIMLLITWITVAYQSIRAGLMNPVDVLKDE